MLHKTPMLHKPAGRTVRWVAAAAAVVMVAVLASTRMAAAVQPSKLATKTFLPTGAEQTYKVPAGVRTVRITAVGATGGFGFALLNIEHPGRGAVVTAAVGVSPRSTLYVEVGANGDDGGWNGGGHSPQAPGGGASFVQTCPSIAFH